MSHELESNDGLILVGRPAWHGIGTVVETAPTMAEARRIAGIEWEPRLRPVFLSSGGRGVEIPTHRAVVRSDEPDAPLAIVSDGYRVGTNTELFALAEATGAPIETLGSFRGGRVVFALVRLPIQIELGLTGADVSKTYALISGSHDMTQAITGGLTSCRVVCANTKRIADREIDGAASTFRIVHTGDMAEKLRAARGILDRATTAAEGFRDVATALADAPMRTATIQELFAEVYQLTYGPIPAADACTDRKTHRARRRALRILSEWTANLDHRFQRIDGVQGTAWSVFNAVTQWADHSRTVRRTEGMDRENARVHGNLFGTGDALKRTALVAVRKAVGQ